MTRNDSTLFARILCFDIVDKKNPKLLLKIDMFRGLQVNKENYYSMQSTVGFKQQYH